MAHGADAELTPTGRAMLHALTATIAAANGNRSRALRYIRLAEDEYAHTNPAHDPPWITWFDPAELAGEPGSAIALLATDHEDLGDQALHRLTTSATAHGASEQRSTALAWIRAAAVHAARRDTRHAANATRHALDVTTRLRSPRVADELHHLRTTLQPLQGSNEITELIRQITKLKP